MQILFLHQNFPGQFVHIVRALHGRKGVQLAVVTDAANNRPNTLPTARYTLKPEAPGRPHPLAVSFAMRVARAEAAAEAMLALKAKGLSPDIIIGHLGWGETLFVRDIFPEAKLVIYAEYYYHAKGADSDFDPEFFTGKDHHRAMSLRAKNASLLPAVVDADFAVAPTRWQASRFPREVQHKISVLHEGIDTDLLSPNAEATFNLKESGLTLTANDEVITFVNRNLEPYRGYHIFMRALPAILKARPKAQVVIVGGADVSYGAPPAKGKSWKQIFLDEVADQLPMERVHFTGKIPYADFVALMQVTSAHVYLTYPFVLSWSMLEAMSAGALVIASRTAPVEEVITDGHNGLLVDFFDAEALADCVVNALTEPEAQQGIRRAARQTIVEGYDLKRRCLPQWLAFLDEVAQAKGFIRSQGQSPRQAVPAPAG